jgi:hypothetical protein
MISERLSNLIVRIQSFKSQRSETRRCCRTYGSTTRLGATILFHFLSLDRITVQKSHIGDSNVLHRIKTTLHAITIEAVQQIPRNTLFRNAGEGLTKQNTVNTSRLTIHFSSFFRRSLLILQYGCSIVVDRARHKYLDLQLRHRKVETEC